MKNIPNHFFCLQCNLQSCLKMLEELLAINKIERYSFNIFADIKQMKYLWISSYLPYPLKNQLSIKMNSNMMAANNKTPKTKQKFAKKQRKFQSPRFKSPRKVTANDNTLCGKKRKNGNKNFATPKKRIRLKMNGDMNRKLVKHYFVNESGISAMASVKYEQSFLTAQISALNEKLHPKQSSSSNTVCVQTQNTRGLDIEQLTALTEKWIIATQDLIQTVIKEKNDPTLNITKMIQHFHGDPDIVRWNEEDEDFY